MAISRIAVDVRDPPVDLVDQITWFDAISGGLVWLEPFDIEEVADAAGVLR